MSVKIQKPVYEHTDQEVNEATEATIEYIIDGDQMSAPFALRGIVVYAVIKALRENDELLYAEPPILDADQLVRRDEVEIQVDEAVEHDMQFYPFGHDRNKTNLSGNFLAQLQNRSGSSGVIRVNQSRAQIKSQDRTRQPEPDTSQLSGPITTRKIEE